MICKAYDIYTCLSLLLHVAPVVELSNQSQFSDNGCHGFGKRLFFELPHFIFALANVKCHAIVLLQIQELLNR